MAKKKVKDLNPIDLKEKVTMYAPKGATYHSEGEEIEIHPVHVAKFTKKGFTTDKPKSK